MDHKKVSILTAGSFIIKRRLLFMIVFGICSAVFEIVEHYFLDGVIFDEDMFLEIIFHSLFIPLTVLVVLELIERSLIQQEKLVNRFMHAQEINQELGRIKKWDELIDLFKNVLKSLAPTHSAALWIRENASSSMKLVSSWQIGENPGAEQFSRYCSKCIPYYQSKMPLNDNLLLCNKEDAPVNVVQGQTRICLHLTHSGELMGILQIALPPNIFLTLDQEDYLKDLVPMLALSIDVVLLQNTVIQTNQANENERNQIRNDLHDILGQDLAYLKIKLEKLSQRVPAAIEKDLDRMSEIAEEAYGVVRGTLATLQYENNPNLEAILSDLANQITARLGVKVLISSQGNYQALPSMIQRQLQYIIREILANVEKHSHANQVSIQLVWAMDELVITVMDDGIGFAAPEPGHSGGHYGIQIMRDRAQRISGNLEIISDPGVGTKVTLQVPIQEPSEVGYF